MIRATFHLSLTVPDVEASIEFFTNTLGATVTHRDPSGYVNVDFFGTQLTLARGDAAAARAERFHFGVNLPMPTFEAIAERLRVKPQTVDAGTPLERRKLYVRCPAGYVIELKGLPG